MQYFKERVYITLILCNNAFRRLLKLIVLWGGRSGCESHWVSCCSCEEKCCSWEEKCCSWEEKCCRTCTVSTQAHVRRRQIPELAGAWAGNEYIVAHVRRMMELRCRHLPPPADHSSWTGITSKSHFHLPLPMVPASAMNRRGPHGGTTSRGMWDRR